MQEGDSRSKSALRSRAVQNLLDQLANPGSGRESYFVVAPGSSNRLTPGVYRRYRLKSEISAAFVFAKQQKNPGAVVACIRQLDHMTGTGYNSHHGHGMRRY